MSKELESSTFMSLADMAAMNTDNIAVLTSRLPEAGVYIVKGDAVVGRQSEPRSPDEPGLISFNFSAEILQANLLDKTKDGERLVGRKLNENYTLWPDQVSDLIGLLRGRYQLVGLDNTGILGGVEGMEPGWLDGMVGHVFQIRVRRYTGKSGEKASFDWLKYERPEGEQLELETDHEVGVEDDAATA